MRDVLISSPRAIVAGHGDFAHGMISAVDQISGKGETLIGVAVPDLEIGAIEELLRSKMEDAGVRVVFTDLQAGSCSMAARRILRGKGDAVLVCGSNLPMLLDFVFADAMDPVDAARHAAERGRAAIAFLEGSA
jgi:N-acetylgalactosamine PTS system EIIA component